MTTTGPRNRPLRSPHRPADPTGGRNTPGNQTPTAITEHPTPNPSVRPGEAQAESAIGLFKTELNRNPAALRANGGHWRGLDDLEIATCGWAGWFNEERFHGELDDLTPAEVEAAYYRHQSQPTAA